MMIRKIGMTVWILLCLAGCMRQARLDAVMDLAGENRKELEKVLEHYQDDERKYRAACFLMENMAHRHSVAGKGVDEFYAFIDSVYQIQQQEYDIPAIYEEYRRTARYQGMGLYREWDVKRLTAEQLIRSIDAAFEVWGKPWNSHLTLEEFCEWILPYRLHNELLEDWRLLYRKEFEDVLTDSIRTARQACEAVNNRLIGLPIHIALSSVRPSAIRPSSLIHIKFGLCEDYADLAVYAMRSLGIPVGIEVVPHWGSANNNHTFNVVYDNDGRCYDFSGGENNPGEHLHRFTKDIPKVYRERYGANPESLAMIKGDEEVPPFFRNPYMEDVTGNYPFVGARDIVIPKTIDMKGKFAYLCVFDPGGWTPVAWGSVDRDSVRFRQVGPNIVYHAACYENEELRLSGSPFFLDTSGLMKPFVPSITLQDMKLERKNPESPNLSTIPGLVVGGRFQGADNPQFRNAEDLYVIEEEPPFKYVSVPLSPSQPYKYLRFLTAKECNGHMAEIEFYREGSDSPLTGKVIGEYEPSIYYPLNVAEKMFDGDALTFFHTGNDPVWGGLQLEKAEKVDSLRFIIRNDDNGIRRDNLYELFYMKDGRWVSLGRQTAEKDDELVYEQVPSGALYWLRNLTRGKEERIFGYEDGRQVWY